MSVNCGLQLIRLFPNTLTVNMSNRRTICIKILNSFLNQSRYFFQAPSTRSAVNLLLKLNMKTNNNVTVYYSGRLKTTNKLFDAMTSGSGLTFRLGRGEVIDGWDIGLVGMRVGGKRIITCPPNMAYGSKGFPPKIPPNSTLVFEVELKAVQ